ncbi:hypothetical protein ACEN9F_30520 [Duganella sp. CT11-25]|uniref:hypothetical protein n=1 Tax=unclassified Duganella TaxID=2636909 RepID=UPI0039B0742C
MSAIDKALHQILATAITLAPAHRCDPVEAAKTAARAFRAGLAEFELALAAKAVSATVDPHFVLIPQTTLQRADGSSLVVPAFWYARYPASKGADGKVVHDISAKPWVNIAFDAAGKAAEAVGMQVSRETQELVVRHLICQQPENWISGKVGEGAVYQGLHRGTVSSAQAADYQAAENERNWHVLPGGERVYGVAGNVWTWAHDDVQGDARGLVADRMKADSISLTTAPYPSNKKGMGYRTSGGESWSGVALLRGGFWVDGDDAGVFRLSYLHPSRAVDDVGFRCTKPA